MKNIIRGTLALGLVTLLSSGTINAFAAVSGHWVYDVNGREFISSGQTLSGWQVINGRWHYLDPNKGNHLATNQTVNGKYYVDKNGVWNEAGGYVKSEKSYESMENQLGANSNTSASNLGNQVADTNSYGGHSINEVINKWNTLKPTFNGTNIFDVQPNLKAPYAPGKVNSSYLNDTLNNLNFARYLADLEPVQLDEDLTNKAQYGALLTTLNNELVHVMTNHPSDMSNSIYKQGEKATSTSNLCGGKVLGSILECLNDNNNLMGYDNIGHREWLLDPEVTKIGFGTTSNYSVQCLPFDDFDTSANKPDYLAWPSKGAFPNSFIRRQAVWSIGLNKDVYKINNNVKIKLTRLQDGKVWNLNKVNSFSKDTTGFEILSDNQYGFGRNYHTIIFRIGDGDLSVGKYLGSYQVEISGLNKDLKYTTNFFDLNN